MRDHFLAVEVAVQTQRERKRAHDLLDEVERQHEQEGLDEALEIAAQTAALDADGVRHAKGDDGQTRRDGQRGRRHGEYLPRAGQQPDVVGHDDEDEKRRHHREVATGVGRTHDAAVKALQLFHGHLGCVLQRAGHVAQLPCRQPRYQRQHGHDDPHGHDRAGDLQRSDGKQYVRFTHLCRPSVRPPGYAPASGFVPRRAVRPRP